MTAYNIFVLMGLKCYSTLLPWIRPCHSNPRKMKGKRKIAKESGCVTLFFVDVRRRSQASSELSWQGKPLPAHYPPVQMRQFPKKSNFPSTLREHVCCRFFLLWFFSYSALILCTKNDTFRIFSCTSSE